MSPTKATVGLFVPLVAKSEKVQDTEKFLHAGYDIVSKNEPLTAQWFALQQADDSTKLTIFDTFAAEEGRNAHVTGDVAKALGANAPDLLSVSPSIHKVVILASKVVAPPANAGLKAGLLNGLIVDIIPKPEKVGTVRDFLTNALPLVEAEPETLAWYAIEYPDVGKFAIIDFFPSEEGRNAHVAGEVAKALFGSVDELLTGQPAIAKVDVLAADIKA